MTKRYCNYCGKELKTDYDYHHIYLPMYYGSKYDGDNVSVDLCIECTDKLIDFLNPLCRHDILTDSDTDSFTE